MLYSEILLNGLINKGEVAIICDDIVYTYKELIYEVDKIALGLSKEGIKKNSKVMVLVEDPVQFTKLIFAINKIKAVCIPIYGKTGKDKIVQIIDKYDINFIIKSDDWNIEQLPYPYVKLQNSVIIYKYSKKIDNTIDNVELILFTSGTTSIPKAIMLSNDNIISNVLSISEYIKPSLNDKIFLIKNLSHSSSIIGELFVGIRSGCTIVMTKKLPITSTILKIMQKEKITIFFSIPTLLVGIIKYPKIGEYNFENLRIINFYGSKMSKENILKLIKIFPYSNIIYSYGLTEASPRVTYIEKKDLILKLGSSGKPIRNVQVKIENKTGEYVNGYEVGEIVVSGPNVMQGYYKDFEKTKETIHSGKLFTKDMGYIDDDGFLFVNGRKDNMFISAGKNIYPEEIENVLSSYSDIQEALVKCISNESGIARIWAYVKMVDNKELDTNDIFKYCKLNLENYKIPYKIIAVKELKKTPTGKIMRSQQYN